MECKGEKLFSLRKVLEGRSTSERNTKVFAVDSRGDPFCLVFKKSFSLNTDTRKMEAGSWQKKLNKTRKRRNNGYSSSPRFLDTSGL